ncbi:hypothetical protein [Treponema sp. C6A8]|uniref:hypothetical protein n=1 Tax=Treponema sp. C6A8 TaxID=1410609 RepID=UPI00047FD096|nr:hypothetical protein [Treponema sp. C6A8]
MKTSLKIVYTIASILSLLVVFTFRSVPQGRLWKKYSVLYVAAGAPEESVQKTLSENGVEKYACYTNQYVPLVLKENSPEASLLRLSAKDSYLTKRQAFFFDKSQNYKLYYVPSSYKAQLEKTVAALNQQKISSGIDSNASYPFLIPLFVLVFSGILLGFAKNKVVYAVGAVYSVCFALCNPFYPVAASLIIVLLFFFVMSNLWKRQGVFELVRQSRIFLVLLAVVLLNIICSSLLTVVLFFFFVGGVFSALCIYSEIERYRISKLHFQSLFILPAKRIDYFSNKAFLILPVSVLAVFMFLMVSLVTTRTSAGSHLSKITLPGKSGALSSELPQFDGYYKWNWKIQTSPYVSLNSSGGNDSSDIKLSQKIEFPYYEESDQKIEVKTKSFVFDEAFCNNSYNQIDNLYGNSVERILKSEGKDSTFGYVSLNSYSMSTLSIIMILICFFILLFIYISSIIKKDSRGRGK